MIAGAMSMGALRRLSALGVIDGNFGKNEGK